MPIFELILYIMAVVVLSSFLERFIPRVSVPLVQIAMGIIAAELPFFSKRIFRSKHVYGRYSCATYIL